VAGGRDGQELGQSLHDAKDDGAEDIAHASTVGAAVRRGNCIYVKNAPSPSNVAALIGAFRRIKTRAAATD
jgi:hypothetical protein